MIAAFGGNAYTLAAAPLLPWWAIVALAGAAALVLALGLWRRAGGVWWRTAAVLMLLAILVNPSLGAGAAGGRGPGGRREGLWAGGPDEADRRLVVAKAPSFGLVGKELPLSIRVEDLPAPPKDSQSKPEGQARVTWRKDGGAPQSLM